MTIFDTNGTTVLGTAVADALGNWTIASSLLSDGDPQLTARETDIAGNQGRPRRRSGHHRHDVGGAERAGPGGGVTRWSDRHEGGQHHE